MIGTARKGERPASEGEPYQASLRWSWSNSLRILELSGSRYSRRQPSCEVLILTKSLGIAEDFLGWPAGGWGWLREAIAFMRERPLCR